MRNIQPIQTSKNFHSIPPTEELEKPSDFVGYGIYDKDKNTKISIRFPGLQNILRAKLTAIHDTLELTTTDPDPTYIFTNNLNSIYLMYMQLRLSTTRNNHFHKLLLKKLPSIC
jgi:hypothetical protein